MSSTNVTGSNNYFVFEANLTLEELVIIGVDNYVDYPADMIF